MPSGSWALVEELFERGDPEFAAELRGIHDAERLGKFAARWVADSRPFARKALKDYFSLPLNAYRHEAMVKRLFKLIEKAGDDEVMGVLLVGFDRSIRRQRKTITRHKWDNVADLSEAQKKLREWEAEGYETPPWQNWQSARGRLHIYASKKEEVVVAPPNTMPRPPKNEWQRQQPISDNSRKRFEARFVLFSVPTRRYLRRRAWRYFRKIAKTDLDRYRRAAVNYLWRYRDVDVDSDIHLLDNWGLVHTLFGESPALIRPASGWEFAPGMSLAHLTAAPRFADAWRNAPNALLDLVLNSPCRTVRQWSRSLLETDHRDWLNQQSMYVLLKLVDHADPDVAALGFDAIEHHPDLSSVPIEAWLARLEGDDLDKLQRISSLLERKLDPNRVALHEAVKLAMGRSLPVANFGLALLRGRPTPTETDLPVLLLLVQSECEAARPRIVEWLRDTLEKIGPTRFEWLLEFLDSKHADVRTIGWQWLMANPLRDEPAIWHRLLESPYDDVKGPMVAALTERTKGANRDLVRLLWASVLLNLYGGGRNKPGVVSQIVIHLGKHPEEANDLLSLLAIAVRSLRGPEFRAGLTGIVSLYEDRPELRPAIAKQFPELSV